MSWRDALLSPIVVLTGVGLGLISLGFWALAGHIAGLLLPLGLSVLLTSWLAMVVWEDGDG